MSTMQQPPQDGVAIDPYGIASPYERFVARRIRRRMLHAVGLSQARLLHTDWGETHDFLYSLLEDYSDGGVIGHDEYDDLLDAGIIAAGQDAAGLCAYAVVEIGVTVNSEHVDRAARRASALARATGAECKAIVVGGEIPDAEQERATQAGVVVIAAYEAD